MTHEDKELLLKDLCARLPYEVKAQVYNHWRSEYEYETLTLKNYHELIDTFCVEDIKPYLFPLSSMTEEQKNDCPIDETNLNIIKSNIGYGIIEIPWQLLYLFIDWCNKNHFDYRGLIPKDLAIDSTGLNIYQ